VGGHHPGNAGRLLSGKTREEARKNVLDALSELMMARRELALRERSPEADFEKLPLGATVQ